MSEKEKRQYREEGALRILEALSAVDEELLAGCDISVKQQKKLIPLFKYGRACAACLCLILVGALSWYGFQNTWRMGTSSDSASPQNGSASYEAAQETEGYPAGGIAESADMEEGIDTTTGSAASSDRNDAGVDSADRLAEDKLREEFSQDKLEDTQQSLEAEASEKLTEMQARQTEGLGEYLPTKLPAGYRFENAWIGREGQVTMTWSRGMDSIMISVSLVVPETVETVNIEHPETYDERLYKIPYSETVPGEYFDTFDNPVFASEDLSLEIIRSRLLAHDDSGDTDTPRGRFSVLFPDGVLLSFNGRGTPEEIWTMLSE